MDRGYCSLDLIATMQENPQLDYIIRARSNFIREARNLPEAECNFDVSFTIITRQINENKETIRKGLMKWLPGESTKGKVNKTVTWLHEDGYQTGSAS